MTLGPLMVDIDGYELTAADRELLRHPSVGGIILFARNYASTEQVSALIDTIHRLRDPHLLVAVDQEGGRVQRFRDGFTRLPPVACLGRIYEQDKVRARHLAEVSGWLMASELRAVGVDISFAPVLDLDHGVSTVIGNRALHRRPEIVAALAQAYQRGMQSAGMAATGKHFPGHGAVVADSHHDLPVDTRSYADIAQWDLVPFERMIHAGLAAVMMAHVIYSAVDANAAGFSPFWIREVLRKRLEFQGVVFSDDLSMAAAACAGGYQERACIALEAGCDMVLVCNQPEQAAQVVESLAGYSDPAAHLRLARMHAAACPPRKQLLDCRRYRGTAALLEQCQAERWLDMDLD